MEHPDSQCVKHVYRSTVPARLTGGFYVNSIDDSTVQAVNEQFSKQFKAAFSLPHFTTSIVDLSGELRRWCYGILGTTWWCVTSVQNSSITYLLTRDSILYFWLEVGLCSAVGKVDQILIYSILSECRIRKRCGNLWAILDTKLRAYEKVIKRIIC